jgi:holo-[acyl-carrier protein] synthase
MKGSLPNTQINRGGFTPRHLPAKSVAAWGIGVDIEDVDRFRKALRSSSRFFSKTFTKKEIEYCKSKGDPGVHFAGTFAAKEATYKASNHLVGHRVVITDFEVLHDAKGGPRVRYVGGGAKHLVIKVSISHTLDYAVAVAFARLGL